LGWRRVEDFKKWGSSNFDGRLMGTAKGLALMGIATLNEQALTQGRIILPRIGHNQEVFFLLR
jgi:hypothetical protein